MPSFDLVSKVDLQTLDNAVNTVEKEIKNRFDFKGSHVVINLNKKEFKLDLEAESEMKMNQVIDVLISRSLKQGLAAEVYDFSKEAYQSGKVLKKEVPVRNGIKQEDAKKIVKLIKDSGHKVQAAIMDDIIFPENRMGMIGDLRGLKATTLVNTHINDHRIRFHAAYRTFRNYARAAAVFCTQGANGHIAGGNRLFKNNRLNNRCKNPCANIILQTAQFIN